jgi:cell division septum initiation protein DivIVA
MSRKNKDYTPKFHRDKHYAIGALQNNSSPTDVPDRFAKTPVPPLHISGAELLSFGIKTTNSFLRSSNCHHKIGSTVYFYEVEYGDGEPRYKAFYSGSPLSRSVVHSALSDGSATPTSDSNSLNVQNFLPHISNESEKMLHRVQNERVGVLEKMVDGKEKEFTKERGKFADEIKELHSEIIKLNSEISRRDAELSSLNITTTIEKASLEAKANALEQSLSSNDFQSERLKYLDEIKGLTNQIIDLNKSISQKDVSYQTLEMQSRIEKASLESKIEALQMRHSEDRRTIDRFMDRDEDSSPQPSRLADATSRIDMMLGDGASAMLLGKLAEGAGAGIGKLIDLGIN